MVKPFSQLVQDKIDKAKLRVQERLFKDFVACKNDEERRDIGAKMDVLSNIMTMVKKELKDMTD